MAALGRSASKQFEHTGGLLVWDKKKWRGTIRLQVGIDQLGNTKIYYERHEIPVGWTSKLKRSMQLTTNIFM